MEDQGASKWGRVDKKMQLYDFIKRNLKYDRDKNELPVFEINYLDTLFENSKIDYYCLSEKRELTFESNSNIATHKSIHLGYNINKKPIFAFYWKGHGDNDTWFGCDVQTIEGFEARTKKIEEKKDNTPYKVQKISFKNATKAQHFFQKLHSILLNENWQFKNDFYEDSSPKYTILESYLGHTLNKIICDSDEEKETTSENLLFSNDRKYCIFNTGLLTTFAKPVYLVGENFTESKNDSETDETTDIIEFRNPRFFENKYSKELHKKNFDLINNELPQMVKYYSDNDVNQITFNPYLDIAFDSNSLNHINEGKRKGRMFNCDRYESEELARLTEDASFLSREIAKRNYKFVVPHYFVSQNKIQFIMPIYIDGLKNAPNFTLVLDPCEGSNEIEAHYKATTVLTLSMAYNNSRLICKPDDAWLKPDEIDDSLEDNI